MPEAIVSLPGTQMGIYEENYRDQIDHRMLILRDVDDSIIDEIVMYILKWNKEDINIPKNKRIPIKLYISTPGGNVFDANILSDVIEQSITPVIGIAFDLVASAGLSIYLTCHERIAFKNSAFLLHDGEIAIENSRKKSKDAMEFFNEGDVRTKEHVLKYTNIDSDFYDSIFSDDYWFYAQKGKELGVVDKIIGEDVTLDYVI